MYCHTSDSGQDMLGESAEEQCSISFNNKSKQDTTTHIKLEPLHPMHNKINTK
jgi:hypothetical protein